MTTTSEDFLLIRTVRMDGHNMEILGELSRGTLGRQGVTGHGSFAGIWAFDSILV